MHSSLRLAMLAVALVAALLCCAATVTEARPTRAVEGPLLHRAPRVRSSPKPVGESPFVVAAGEEQWPEPLAMHDPSAACSFCTQLVTDAGIASQDPTQMASLLTALQGQCALNTSTALLCDIIVGALVKELPKLPEILVKAGAYTPAIACAIIGQCSVNCCVDNTPTQIHLAVAGPTSMAVVWMTAGPNVDRNVSYGINPDSLDQSATADIHTYTAGGWVGSIHTAVMTDLKPGQTYHYVVGGPNTGSSAALNFSAPSEVLREDFTLLVTGDMGAETNFSGPNQQWINFVAQQGVIDGVVHIGDISYADGYMERWDQLFTSLGGATSRVPYMTVPGNHEVDYNFTSYQNRFSMPTVASGAPFDGMYYSYDQGCIHLVGINSESELDTAYISKEQVAWLDADLTAVNKRRQAAREARANAEEEQDEDEVEEESYDAATCSTASPTFIVVYMHRPMYCSTGGKQGTKRCIKEAAYLQGLVEDVLYKHKVDLVFAGHVHSYERSTNVYQGKIDPRGPVYILNGVGGNREGTSDNWQDPLPAYSQVHMGVTGLGHLTVVNSTTLNWSFFKQTDLDAAFKAGSTQPLVSDQVFIHARQ